MKTIKKVLILLIGIISIIGINISTTYASDLLLDKTNFAQISITDMKKKADDFLTHGSNNQIGGLTEGEVASEFLPLGQILVFIASGVLLIVTVIMGIKWITANPEQQGKLKQQLIGLVVAIVVIYGAVGIWTMIKGFMEGL